MFDETQTAAQATGVLRMKRTTRIQYTDSHKALMWDRWRQGESLHQIARLFDRHHSSVRGVLAETVEIRPAVRRRSTRALVAGHTIRLIASLFQLTDGERTVDEAMERWRAGARQRTSCRHQRHPAASAARRSCPGLSSQGLHGPPRPSGRLRAACHR